MREEDKSRLQMVVVDEDVIGKLLFRQQCQGDIFLRGNNLPNDVELVGVYYDFTRRAFLFKLRHNSFDVVSLGEVVPMADVTMTQFRLTLTKEQQLEANEWLKS